MKSPSSSFSSNECIESSKIGPPGCLTGVFRRFLGYVYNSKKPVDRFQEIRKDSEGVDELGNVGLVAKLMGLDSMPRVDLGSDKKNLKSITWSRSMNSAETLRGFEQKNGKHRRVRSSTFSKEGSGYLEFENDKFFVISFESDGQTEKFRSELTNDVGFGELRPKRSEKSRTKSKNREKINQENQEPNKNFVWSDGKFEGSKNVLDPIKNSQENSRTEVEIVNTSKPMQVKSRSEKRKLRRNRKENISPIKKLDSDCDSENSSPISVLDYVQFPVNVEVNSSEKHSTGLISRRKLSKKLDKLEQFSCEDTKSTISDSEEKKIESKLDGLRWKESTNDNYEELWGEICKLAEKDMMQCNFMFKEEYKFKDFEEICIYFGSKILDQLLVELVSSNSYLTLV